MLRWVVIHKSSANVHLRSSRRDAQAWNSPLGIHTDLPCVLQGHSTLTATELREKLLREKVKALRKSSTTQKELEVDGG